MKISVILAHPDKKSFNHAIAATAIETLKQNGHEVFFHDLYEEEFDPLLTAEEIPRGVALPFEVEKHCNEISAADGVVIIHPNWSPNALLTFSNTSCPGYLCFAPDFLRCCNFRTTRSAVQSCR
jgi:putative NADPH-quinone reductase